ncbi:MAG: MaoC family dehydratase [Chloroflexi bacterium]|nr:MaoC family dehydratase [Chloroflexota bacterium]
MTLARGYAELTVEAFLDHEDRDDIRNPIHASGYARRYGFRGALVGGVTVWGWATPAIIEAAGEAWLDHGWSEFVFRQPTYPGDRLDIRVRPDAGRNDGALSVTMTNQEGVDCVVATVGLGDAAWLGTLQTPRRLEPQPMRDPQPELLLERAPIGQDLIAASFAMTVDDARAYIDQSVRRDDGLFTGERPRLHPGWIAGRVEELLRHNYAMPSSMHTRSQVQHLARADALQTVTAAARCIEAYERKGHHIGVFDCVIVAEDGTKLAHMRHTTIFRIAPPRERV